MAHLEIKESGFSLHKPWARALFGILVAAMVLSLWAVVFQIDLTPQVESDFFFSTGDPAFRATQEIEELFPSSPQLIVSALAPDIRDPEYVERVRQLTEAFAAMPEVTGVQSLTQGPATPAVVPESPIWKRLLLSKNPNATHLMITLTEDAGTDFITRVEELLDGESRPSFDLRVSGVPYVIELIRRYLRRDLRVFSSAALLVFGLVIAVLYRSVPLVAGTLLSCIGACLLTLAVLYVLGVPIGILTANIATIVFVLTLSHTVFLTANWRRIREGIDPDLALSEGVRITFTASFWCMVAALMGFGSLLLASAKPLRELGTSGMVGTAVAIVVAYGFYPFFMRRARYVPPVRVTGSSGGAARVPAFVGPAVVALACAAAALGLPKTNTDPSLLTYFADGSELRSGLELIDKSGGSSPLYLVVADGEERMDTRDADAKLAKLQEKLDEDPAVGVALSLSVLLGEARRVPFAGLLSPEQLVGILSSEQFDNIAASFITDDRKRTLFLLRMHETGREEARQDVVDRLVAAVEASDLEPNLVGGLYDLQGKLGELVASSLVRELGGLLAFFVLVAAAVARSPRVAMAMVACLAGVPILLLGAMAWIGRPIDVISAPGANVAISLGIDAMIHLMMAVRRQRAAGNGLVTAWANACAQMRQPITGAMAILAAGFGIFVLSSFPPTQRFGSLVAAGTLISAVMALVVLPFLATVGASRKSA